MAREALTVIGTVVGAYFGNPQLGYAIGAFVGGLVDPEQINAPSIGDIATQTSAEGIPCPLIAGTAGCAGNLIYASDPRVVKGRFRSGKGGPEVQDPDRVYRTFAIRIGASMFDGPGNRTGITGVRKIWEDEKLVYDVSPTSVILAESAAFARGFTFYPGNETQLPDPDIEAIKGVGNVPAYRGRCYIVFPNKDVTDRRGSISQYRFEVTVGGAEIIGPALITNRDIYTGPGDSLAGLVSDAWSPDNPVARSMAVSPGGTYVTYGLVDPPYIRIQKYDETTETYSPLPDPASLPPLPIGRIVWHPSGNYFVARYNAAMLVYSRSGDTFTLTQTIVDGTAVSIAFSPDGQKFAASFNSATSRTELYPFIDGVLGTPTEDFCTRIQFGATDMSFSPDGLFLVCGGNQGIDVFDTSSAAISHFDEISSQIASAAVCFSGNGGYIYALGGPDLSGNRLGVFSFNAAAIPTSGAIEFDNFPADQPTGSQIADIQQDGDYYAVAEGDAQIKVYAPNGTGDQLTLVASQPPAASGLITEVVWTDASSLTELEAGTTTFEQVVLAAGRRCKIPNSAWNIAEHASKIVRGSVVASQNYTAQDYINSLRLVFPCDGAVYDGLIHLPTRGAAPVRDLDEQFMVEEGDDAEQEETLRNGDDKRIAPIRRPAKINLMFPNAKVGYQLTKATSPNYGDRGDAVNESTLEIPIVLDDTTEAPQLADVLDKISRADAEGEIVRIFPENLAADLVPGSVVRLIGEGGLTRRVRVETGRVGDCTKRLTMRVDRSHAYTSQLTAQPSPEWPTPPPSLPGTTTFVVMNLPILLDSHDTLGVYFGLCGDVDAAWTGAAVDYRVQGATSWIALGAFSTRSVMGVLGADIAAASEFYPDNTNVVTFVPVDPADELESLTEAEWLSERNAAAIVYADGTAEIIQFRDAAQDSGGIWSLSRLQRGRLATVADMHSTGATFVMLETATFVPLPSSLIGQTLEFRVTTNGTSVEEAEVYSLAWDPVKSQTEFPPANLSLVRDGDTISGLVVPRHRRGTEDNPIPSGNWTGYRWTATDGANTQTQDTATVTPRAIFDVTGWASPVTVSVAMTNLFTGPGPTISEAIA